MNWLAAVALVGLSACTGYTQTAKQADSPNTVVIKKFAFTPPELTVKAGATVVWKNDDIVPHTVTGRTLHSGPIPPGEKWTYKASRPGTFEYSCTPHPNMHGRLIVR